MSVPASQLDIADHALRQIRKLGLKWIQTGTDQDWITIN
jgi:hypothetical protein